MCPPLIHLPLFSLSLSLRPDSRTAAASADTPFGRTHVTSLEMLSREGEGLPLIGRASLDVFSPVRDDSHSGATVHRKTPLGTPLTAAGRCYSPLSVFQTPPPIREEEPIPPAATAKPNDYRKASSSSLEGEAQTPPTASQTTNHIQPAPPFFTPELSLRRANGIQAQLSYESPFQAAPPTSTTGPALSASVSSSLSQNIAEVVGQAGAAPLTSLQIHFIQNMIHETLEEFRDACHRDIVNLQVEMVRQFYIQLNEIHGLIEKYSVNESLVEEVEKLREENRRLKTNY
ncbi:protein NEDD1 [Perca fluviatilis]|uniref:protein NEDD1 n=1 Tax=Perca fluviatilis TaxID=8168 RepID=UPI0019626736|nr:protein NEDD1 [Perca fluviatilis]